MGGTGSGRWAYYHKKRSVEECWTISISDTARMVDLRAFGPGSGTLLPINPSMAGTHMSLMRCTPKFNDDSKPLLELSYTVKDRWSLEHRVEQVLRLQTTRPNFGGVRWWFSCPRILDGKECGRRVGKLYLSPGGRYFACRRCLDLTYESCQTSHRHDGLFALVAGEASGERFEAVKRAFCNQSKKARRRRAEPSPNLLDAYDEMFVEAEGR